MTYDLYRTLHINIKKYIKSGDVHDPDWLINSNLANSKSAAERIIKLKSKSMLADAIIFNHYPNEVFENIRKEKARFNEKEFKEFHSFMHKLKNTIKNDRSILF